MREASQENGCQGMNAPASKFQDPGPRTLVLGLGNPILTDDGVGIHIVRAVASQRTSANGVTFAEASVGGLRLLDLLDGYDRAILIDAILTPEGRPGDVYRVHPGDLKGSLHSSSTHDLSLPGALDLGRQLGMKLPDDEDLIILAIEVQDVLTFGESCTPAVARAIPTVLETMSIELNQFE